MSASDALGVQFAHDKLNVLSWQKAEHFATAKIDGKEAGMVRWESDGDRAGRVVHIGVAAQHQRQGVATSLYRYAQQVDPRVHHSETQTDDGKAWAQAEARKP